jgi:RND family efflux transporter MFP subunit
MTREFQTECGAVCGRWTRAIAVALLAGAAMTIAACGGGCAPGAPAAGGRAGGPAMPVETVVLAPKPVEQVAEYVGTIRSRRSTRIQPQAEGYLTKILVASGALVQPGTPLFEIDAAPQRAVVATLESMRAARDADATFARQQAERAKSLLAVGAMSQQEYDQAATQQKSTEAQLRAIDEQIRQQQAELAYYRVVAPTGGVVGDVPVREGDRVTRSTVLTTLDDNAGLEVYLNVPVQQAPGLRPGLLVRIMNDTGDVIATTRISFIAPSVDDATQSVLVKAPVESVGRTFRTEQIVRAQVVFDTASGLTVPVVAATRVNGVYFVFVVDTTGRGTVARQRPITVGRIIANEYVVSSGLAAGDRLIVSGIQKIGDGAPVAVSAGAAPAAGVQ